MKNALLKLLLKVGPKKKFKKRGERRILIVSTTGLGDSLWAAPAVRALRQKYPNSFIALLTSLVGGEVFTHSPYIDEIFTLKNPIFFPLLKLIPTLRKKTFDTAYLFHASQRATLPLICLAGPSKIVGTQGGSKGLDGLLTHPMPNRHVHEIQRRLHLIGSEEACPKMEVFPTEQEKKRAHVYLPKCSLSIGLHPGAKDRFKQWNPKHFIELGKRLAHERGATIFVTGNAGEVDLAENIAQQIPNALSVAGKLSIRTLGAFIGKLDLFIANDTGPMHLSLAVGTPTCALFAPTDPNLCGPYKTPHGFVVQKPRSCAPCLKKKCALPFCLEQIAPNMVYEALDAHLPN